MGRLYSSVGDQTAAANATLWTLQSATTIKPEVQDINVGCIGAPADAASRFQVYRFTVDDGTGSTPAMEAHDPDAPTALGLVQDNHTAEPSTKGNAIFELGLHQRASFRHVMAPGRGWIANNVATEGFGFQFVSTTSTVDSHSTLTWEE